MSFVKNSTYPEYVFGLVPDCLSVSKKTDSSMFGTLWKIGRSNNGNQ